MRLVCEFEFDGELVLPIHYNHIIQGFIYKNISDKILKSFIHEVGFKYGKRQYKMFTYSKILGRFRMDAAAKKIIFSSPITIHISSLVDDFINSVGNSLFKSDVLGLEGKSIRLANVIAENPVINRDELEIRMISPVVTYTTLSIDGRKKCIYYSPKEKMFSEKIRDNILRKYEAIENELPQDTQFEIRYIGHKDPKNIIINYKGTTIKGYEGYYELRGNPKLLRMAYLAGIGSKNSQGFGCFEILKK